MRILKILDQNGACGVVSFTLDSVRLHDFETRLLHTHGQSDASGIRKSVRLLQRPNGC